VTERLETDERRIAHGADVVYATVHQVGYDLLRDRQRTPGVGRLVGELDACLIDEIDAVLIDDAMVPLLPAGDAESTPADDAVTAILSGFREGVEDEIDDDRRGVAFTDAGLARLERELGTDDLYAPEQIGVLTAAHVALHARALVERDVHYVVVDGRVQLGDDARGRIADRQRGPHGP